MGKSEDYLEGFAGLVVQLVCFGFVGFLGFFRLEIEA